MRKNSILSALKQKFSNSFLSVFAVAFVIAIFIVIIKPFFDFWPTFLALFILIMAVYLILSVKPRKLRKGKKEMTPLEEEKELLLKDEDSIMKKLAETDETLIKLHEKKKQFANMPLNSAEIDNEIRLAEQWDRDIPSNNLKSARERIKEIDVEIDKKNKKIRSFFTR